MTTIRKIPLCVSTRLPAETSADSRSQAVRRCLNPWFAVLMSALVWGAGGIGEGVTSPSGPEQPDRDRQAAEDLAVRMDRLRAQGKFAEAAQQAKRWLDINGDRLAVPDRVGLMRTLAELQLEADQVGDAIDTLRGVVRTMTDKKKDFQDWMVRSVTADLSDLAQLRKLKGPERKRLALARGHLRAIDAEKGSGDELTEEDRIRARKHKAQLDEDLKAAVKILGDKNPSALLANIRESLGLALLPLQEWGRAETEITEALRARTALYGKVHPQTAQTHGMLALVLSDPQRPDPRNGEAIAHYSEAAAVFERTLGLADSNTRRELDSVAVRCLSIGRADLALVFAQRLLTAVRRAFPKDEQRWISAMTLVAQTAKDSGNFPVAEKTYKEVRNIEHSFGNRYGEARAWMGLGTVLAQTDALSEAIKALKKALALFEKIPGAESDLDRVSCLVPLAYCHQAGGDVPEARACLESARRILATRPGPSITAMTMHLQRGRLLRSLKDWTGAQQAFQAALAAVPAEVVTVTTPLVAEARNLLAATELQLGNPAEALKQLKEALALCLARLGTQHFATANAQLALGQLQLQLGDAASARESLDPALAGIVKASDSLSLMAESEAVRRLEQVINARDLLLSAMRVEKDKPSALYEHVWQSKGLLTRHTMTRFAQAAADSLLDRDLAEKLNSLRQVKVELSNLLWTDPRPTEPEIRQRLTTLASQKKLLESQLVFRPQTIGPQTKPAGLEELAKLLPSNVAVVDFIMTSQFAPTKDRKEIHREKIYYEAYVLRSMSAGRGLEVKRIELGTQRALGPILSRWREAVSRQTKYTRHVTPKNKLPAEPDFIELLAAMPDDRAYLGCGQLLREAVWNRIEPHLSGIDTVVMLPDFDFDCMPWYALPGKKADTDLIDDYAICNVLNGQHLMSLLRSAVNSAASKQLTAAKTVAKPQGCLIVGDLQYGNKRWTPLEWSKKEIQAVMDIKSVPTPRELLTRRQARPDKVAEEMMRRRYVHLATHAAFGTDRFKSAFMPGISFQKNKQYLRPIVPDARFQDKLESLAARRAGGKEPARDRDEEAASLVLEECPLSCAALALSKATGGTSSWDTADVLTGEVIVSLDLRGLDLAVLSACETSRGPALLGEGTLSLQRAFLMAGTRSVVGSLWKVDDPATKELMMVFYANLWSKGLTRVEALRSALRTMRNFYNVEKQRVEISDDPLPPGIRTPPRLWAAFMLSGEWGKLKNN